MSNNYPIAPFNPMHVDPNLSDVLIELTKNIKLEFNCHHIAQIQSFNPTNQTVVATVMYKKAYSKQNADGTYSPIYKDYATMIDMPLMILSGGNASLTFPVAKGDECLICFNDRAIDNWFASGQNIQLPSGRLHSFSDGIAIVGVRSLARSLASYDMTRAVLQNGTTMVGVSSSKVKIANATTTLNTVLQNILTQLETLAGTTCVNGSPLNPAVQSQLSTLATTLGGLIE
jgi:hypothetical protein